MENVAGNYEALKYLGAGLTALGMMGAAIGVGNIFAAMLNGIARNPAAEGKLAKYVYVGAGLAEAMGLFALVIALLLIFAA
jgi:F-type H+-transporting ATPase subunit c